MSRRTIVQTLARLLLCACCAGAARAQSLRPFTVEDFLGVKWRTSAQISPDGSQIAYTVAEADAANNR